MAENTRQDQSQTATLPYRHVVKVEIGDLVHLGDGGGLWLVTDTWRSWDVLDGAYQTNHSTVGQDDGDMVRLLSMQHRGWSESRIREVERQEVRRIWKGAR